MLVVINGKTRERTSSAFCTAFGLWPVRCRTCLHRPFEIRHANHSFWEFRHPEAVLVSFVAFLIHHNRDGHPSFTALLTTLQKASFSSSPEPRWPKPFFLRKSWRLLVHDLRGAMEAQRHFAAVRRG